jgi:hypothetical protein
LRRSAGLFPTRDSGDSPHVVVSLTIPATCSSFGGTVWKVALNARSVPDIGRFFLSDSFRRSCRCQRGRPRGALCRSRRLCLVDFGPLLGSGLAESRARARGPGLSGLAPLRSQGIGVNQHGSCGVGPEESWAPDRALLGSVNRQSLLARLWVEGRGGSGESRQTHGGDRPVRP